MCSPALGHSFLPYLHFLDRGHFFDPQPESQVAPTAQLKLNRFPLDKYTLLSPRELLDEAGLPPEFTPEVAFEHIKTFLAPNSTSFLKLNKMCMDKNLSPNDEVFPLNKDTFPCAPWWLQVRQIRRSLMRKSPPPPKEKRRVDYRIVDNWKKAKELTFAENLSSLAVLKKEHFMKLLGEIKKAPTDCQFANAYGALTTRAEAYFPEPEAMGLLTDSYTLAKGCFTPTNPHWERTHLRVGLHFLMAGQMEPARDAFTKALEGSQSKEQFRSLFWLGAIEAGAISKLGPDEVAKLQKNDHWKMLLEEFPLSIHAIMASHTIGKDPKSNLLSDSEVFVERRSVGGWTEFNVIGLLFEFLRSYKSGIALSEWSQFVGRNTAKLTAEEHLFLALHQHAVGNYRLAILGMSRYLREKKNEKVSLKFLDLFFPRPFTDEVLELSQDVDPVLILSLIRQESAFDPRARSSANARGLMQVLPSTANLIMPIAAEDLYNGPLNIKVGVAFFKRLLNRYKGQVEHVLAAYNAGPTPVDRWRRRLPDTNIMLFSDLVPFFETRNYISIILRNAYWYGRLLVINDDGHAKILQEKSAKAQWRSETVADLLKVAWGQQSGQTVLDKVVRFGELKSFMEKEAPTPAPVASPGGASEAVVGQPPPQAPGEPGSAPAVVAPAVVPAGAQGPTVSPPNTRAGAPTPAPGAKGGSPNVGPTAKESVEPVPTPQPTPPTATLKKADAQGAQSRSVPPPNPTVFELENWNH